MASQTDVVNLALTSLGQDRVININDDTESARVIRANWDLALDYLLSSHPWKFAIVRAELAALAAPPLNTWSLQYRLPEDCLKLVQVSTDWIFYSTDVPSFELEGGMILTDEGAPLPVRYVTRINNTGLWPAQFARTMAMQLAADCCEKLTGSSTKGEKAMVERERTITTAKRMSAIERPPQRPNESSWLRARGD